MAERDVVAEEMVENREASAPLVMEDVGTTAEAVLAQGAVMTVADGAAARAAGRPVVGRRAGVR